MLSLTTLSPGTFKLSHMSHTFYMCSGIFTKIVGVTSGHTVKSTTLAL